MKGHRLSAGSQRNQDSPLPLWRLAIVACTLAVAACGAAQTASIGFGTGGVDCELESTGTTFPAGATVRVVAQFDPLPSAVTVSATKDGTPLHDPQTVTLDGSVPCVYGGVRDAEPGHYEYVVTNPESKLPPLTGAFDVVAR